MLKVLCDGNALKPPFAFSHCKITMLKKILQIILRNTFLR